MPTTWHSDDAVEEVHGLVDLLLDECTYNSILPLLGGDFNARLGACENGDDSAVLGTWGLGRRNAVDSCLRDGCYSMACPYVAGWKQTCRWRRAGLANVLLTTL